MCESKSIGEKVKCNSSRAEVLKFSLNAAEATFVVCAHDKIATVLLLQIIITIHIQID